MNCNLVVNGINKPNFLTTNSELPNRYFVYLRHAVLDTLLNSPEAAAFNDERK